MTKGIIILGHGSRRGAVSNSFTRMVRRIARRIDKAPVEPAFFSLGQPTLEEKTRELIEQGCREIIIFPYFLYNGNHVEKDIPAMLQNLRQKYPGVEFRLLATLENEPQVEEIIYERIWPYTEEDKFFSGENIEQKSLDFILNQGIWSHLDKEQKQVTARVVHASADFSFVHSLKFHPLAIEQGISCIREQRKIICDVQMVRTALTRLNNVYCAIGEPDVLARARKENTTRAALAFEKLLPNLDGALVVIGNAPTALWKLLDICAKGGPQPALVVALPVGFVGAAQSKRALMDSDLIYITNEGPKGGSPVAAAVVNALYRLAQDI